MDGKSEVFSTKNPTRFRFSVEAAGTAINAYQPTEHTNNYNLAYPAKATLSDFILLSHIVSLAQRLELNHKLTNIDLSKTD